MYLLAVLALLNLSPAAHAATLECSDPGQRIHLLAELPSGSLGEGRVSLPLRTRAFHVSPAFLPQGSDSRAEQASGGAQWDGSEGLVAVRGERSGHLVVIRLGAWDRFGVARGNVETGAGGALLPVACVLSRVRIGETVLRSRATAPLCPESAEGEPCLMSWAEAASYCQAEGGHLPTARELAAPLSLLGTITVAREEMREPVPEGFYLVPNRDPDGSTYDFYMNHLGYQRPPGARAELLWTASIPPQHPAYAHVLYTAWGGGGGKPEEHLLSYRNAVRCAF